MVLLVDVYRPNYHIVESLRDLLKLFFNACLRQRDQHCLHDDRVELYESQLYLVALAVKLDADGVQNVIEKLRQLLVEIL